MAGKNAVLNYENEFYLSGILLSGLVNIDGGYSIDESPINIIGKGHTYPVRQGTLVGNFNLSKYYIGKEVLLDYVDNIPMSGSINYGDKSFGFTDGYLTEYSLSAGIGQIPQSDASIVVYGDIGSGISATGNNPHPEIQIANQGSISLNTDGFETNRITDFRYSIRVNRTPIYKIGSTFPVQVDTSFPIFQELSISLDVDDFEIQKIREYLIKPNQKDLTLEFSNPISENSIETFTLKNARLLSQSMNSSSDDLLSVSLVYNSYINKRDKTDVYCEPIAINGYYPLYVSAQLAQKAGNGNYHTHPFNDTIYYMPEGIQTWHGDY